MAKRSWQSIARNDSAIQAWWKEMKEQLEIPEAESIDGFMEKSLAYDYPAAIEDGLRPVKMGKRNYYYWPDREIATGKASKPVEHAHYHAYSKGYSE